MGRMFHFKRPHLLSFQLTGGIHNISIDPPLDKSILMFDLPSFRTDIDSNQISGY